MTYDNFLNNELENRDLSEPYDIEEDDPYFKPEYVGKSWKKVIELERQEFELEQYLDNN